MEDTPSPKIFHVLFASVYLPKAGTARTFILGD